MSRHFKVSEEDGVDEHISWERHTQTLREVLEKGAADDEQGPRGKQAQTTSKVFEGGGRRWGTHDLVKTANETPQLASETSQKKNELASEASLQKNELANATSQAIQRLIDNPPVNPIWPKRNLKGLEEDVGIELPWQQSPTHLLGAPANPHNLGAGHLRHAPSLWGKEKEWNILQKTTASQKRDGRRICRLRPGTFVGEDEESSRPLLSLLVASSDSLSVDGSPGLEALRGEFSGCVVIQLFKPYV